MNGKFLILIVTSGLLVGCTQHPKVKVTPPPPEKTKPQDISISISPIPLEPPTLREMENIKEDKVPKENFGEGVNVHLSFNEADIRDALLALAKATGYSIVIPPDIKGKVTVDLNGNSIEECLDDLLSPLGYSYKIEGKKVRVITKTTRIFHIVFPPSQRTFSSNIDATIGSSSGGSDTSGSSGTASMSVANSYTADFWEEVKNTIESILKDDQLAHYSIERSTGVVIVTAKPGKIKEISNFISKLNRFSEKQVLIEAKIVEVKLDKENQTGINWSFLTENNLLGAGATISFSSGSPNNLPFNLQIVKADKSFSSLIGLLSRYGKVNVLSSPRIIAVNGQPAMIKVGKDYIVIYSSQTTSSTTTGGQTANTMITEEIETSSVITEGVVLTIVPKIIGNNQVLLNITPAISSLDTPLTTNTSNTSEFMNKLFAVNVRQLNTVVRAKDGETVILGGLIAESKSKESEGVPVLKDIPIFGIPFRSTNTSTSKSELIIMLTPHIEAEK